ncbi:AAA family ATPase [Corallococcus sp. AS-1-6]|uniref:AAA family ATPase n=1 Tax=Corallococcus sp. AS-1-6 TaxID=2874599 RepID=UPI001CC0ED25|nr:AAA family ATPase [Corallococcus sp. AS-1-6]MBZ4376065.1 AAA family ATPase [Corallococcus sp. AS-1-6]
MSIPKAEGRQLRRFKIRGLHGDRNVCLEIDSQVKILIDSNGSGKTTVLNALYNALTGKTSRLGRLEFEEIIVEFDSGEKVSAPYSRFKHPLIAQLELLEEASRGPYRWLARIFDAIGESGFQNLLEIAQRGLPRSALAELPQLILASKATGIARDELAFRLRQFARDEMGPRMSGVSANPLQELRTLYPHPVLYFPTYRRIEEDLHTLGYLESSLPHAEQLIQFGMGDVQQRIDRITTQIRDSSIEWYSKVNGRILTELIDGIQVTPDMRDSIQDADTLRIVLDRVGENIDERHKNHILELIKSGRIHGEQYSPLVYFLSNLGKVYEQQREKDNTIKEFVRVVNYYLLEDKEVIYNESKLNIGIIQRRTGRPVELERLSSGEKQIVSIFSRLYLDAQHEYVVIFDEPELSLSIEWQRRLLEDIVASRRCRLLVVATHSPFIFENSLDQFAGELNVSPFPGTNAEEAKEGGE